MPSAMYTPKSGKRRPVIGYEALCDSFTFQKLAKNLNHSPKGKPKVASLKLNAVSKMLDFDQVSSTGIVAARKKQEASTLKEQTSVKKRTDKKSK